MKSYNILRNASILLYLLPVLLLVTCKKEDSENSGNGYRIIKAINSLEGIEHNTTLYEYTGDKISMIRGYDGGNELSRSEIFYPDKNTLEMLATYYYETTWHESYKMVYHLAGNQVTQIERYGTDHGTLELSSKETFSYDNDKMTECMMYSFESGNWVPVEKTVYNYNGTLLNQSVNYGYDNEEWQEREKIVIYYKGNQVDTIHYFDYEEGSFIEDSKIGFTYEGDLNMESTIYSYHYGTWIDVVSIQYTYDSNRNLTSISYKDVEYLDKIEYYYEKGSGNYAQLMDDYTNYLFGNIFPHPTKVNKGCREGLHPGISDYFGL